MEKAKVTMRNWEPYVYDGEYNLSGTADVHPRLGRNVYVATTSTLVKASLEEDVLIYETRNTVYHCPLKYMMVSPYGNVVQEYREELARLDTSENALDRIIAAAAKMSLGEPEDTADEMVRKIRALQETGQREIAQMEEQEKQRLIDEVVRLDEGFEILYEKLAKELEGNRQRYAAQIRELQAKVAKVTELSVSVQAQEARNKKLVENYFARERAGIGQRRKNAKSAFDYYKSMSGAGYVPPQMYDNKQ